MLAYSCFSLLAWMCSAQSLTVQGLSLKNNISVENREFFIFKGASFSAHNFTAAVKDTTGKYFLAEYKWSSSGIKLKTLYTVPSNITQEINCCFYRSENGRYLLFQGQNPATEDPDLFLGEWIDKLNSFKIRLAGELNDFEVKERCPVITEDGTLVYYLADGKLMASKRVNVDRVFEFPLPCSIKNLSNEKIHFLCLD